MLFDLFYFQGRVGKIAGQSSQPHSTLDMAKKDFGKKFTDKTKNSWTERQILNQFQENIHSLKEIIVLKMKMQKLKKKDEKTQSQTPAPVSQLDPRVQALISLICDMQMWKAQMIEIGYDANKAPLGKLSKETIKKGYEALKQISDEIDKNNKSNQTFIELSNKFYTYIPVSNQSRCFLSS